MKRLFSAADIRRLGREEKRDTLVVGPDDMLTPEALDLARDMGLRIIRQESAPTSEDEVRRAAEEMLARLARASSTPIVLVKSGDVQLEPFTAANRPDMAPRIKDVITAADGSPMVAGFMSWGKGFFPWTLNYDQIEYVVEGQLEIRHGERIISGVPGDVIYIPRGSRIYFGSPSYVKVFYVTFLAKWTGR
jgi:ethanolamine utilization protein EutQ